MEEIRRDSWRAAYGHLLPAAVFDGFDPASGPDRVRRAGTTLLLAPGEGVAQAFTRFGPTRDEDVTGDEIYALYAVPQAFSTGLGRALMSAALERTARPVTLWVLRDNPRARRFYAAAGLAPDGAQRDITIAGVTLGELRYRLQ